MYATIPVYYPSLEEAARKDEAALWCDSYNINMSCRNFIQDKAMTAFNTRELDAFIEELVRCYGTERAMYVLSRTIQFSDWDARFDQAVLDRAGKTDFPDTREPREAHQVMEENSCCLWSRVTGRGIRNRRRRIANHNRS